MLIILSVLPASVTWDPVSGSGWGTSWGPSVSLSLLPTKREQVPTHLHREPGRVLLRHSLDWSLRASPHGAHRQDLGQSRWEAPGGALQCPAQYARAQGSLRVTPSKSLPKAAWCCL